MTIVIEEMRGVPVAEQVVEIVERKGVGHPDTICDAVMEAISVAYSRACLREFGTVLHHNIDKGLLIAGQAEKWFGGGQLLQPMELIIGDRAAVGVGGEEIPVAEIAVDAARDWLSEHLRYLDPQRDILYRVALAPGSEELTDIFARGGAMRGANDTSAAVGYWPLSPTEEAVLNLEHWLNSAAFKERFPETGEDVKVMGVRHGRTLDLTVAMPLLCQFVGSEKEYFERKALIRREMLDWVETNLPFDAAVSFNALDREGRGLGGVYLSLLGTSAEDADSGQVGRGNRINGLIPVNRPIGTEAVAGKNPVSHVGKIYNVLAHRAAREICARVEGVREAYVLLASRIGEPVDRPVMAAAQLLPAEGVSFEKVRRSAQGALEHALGEIPRLCRELSTENSSHEDRQHHRSRSAF